MTISLTDNDSDNSEVSYSYDCTLTAATLGMSQTVTFSPLEDSTVDGNQVINLDVAVSSDVVETYSNTMDTNRTVTVNDSGLVAPTLDNVTVGEQKLTVYWQLRVCQTTTRSSGVMMTPRKTAVTSRSAIAPPVLIMFMGGLDSSLNYTYYLVANISFSSSDNSFALQQSCKSVLLPKLYPQCRQRPVGLL